MSVGSRAPLRSLSGLVALALAASLLIGPAGIGFPGGQAGAWFRDYAREYPPQQAWENQDGLLEAMTRAIGYAPGFDEVWISYQNTNEPYMYLLAAQPMSPSQAQSQIRVTREPGHFNAITSIGKYYFVRVDDIPKQLPMLEAITDRYGGAAFLLQQWQHDGKRILIVRRMD